MQSPFEGSLNGKQCFFSCAFCPIIFCIGYYLNISKFSEIFGSYFQWTSIIQEQRVTWMRGRGHWGVEGSYGDRNTYSCLEKRGGVKLQGWGIPKEVLAAGSRASCFLFLINLCHACSPFDY